MKKLSHCSRFFLANCWSTQVLNEKCKGSPSQKFFGSFQKMFFHQRMIFVDWWQSCTEKRHVKDYFNSSMSKVWPAGQMQPTENFDRPVAWFTINGIWPEASIVDTIHSTNSLPIICPSHHMWPSWQNFGHPGFIGISFKVRIKGNFLSLRISHIL